MIIAVGYTAVGGPTLHRLPVPLVPLQELPGGLTQQPRASPQPRSPFGHRAAGVDDLVPCQRPATAWREYRLGPCVAPATFTANGVDTDDDPTAPAMPQQLALAHHVVPSISTHPMCRRVTDGSGGGSHPTAIFRPQQQSQQYHHQHKHQHQTQQPQPELQPSPPQPQPMTTALPPVPSAGDPEDDLDLDEAYVASGATTPVGRQTVYQVPGQTPGPITLHAAGAPLAAPASPMSHAPPGAPFRANAAEVPNSIGHVIGAAASAAHVMPPTEAISGRRISRSRGYDDGSPRADDRCFRSALQKTQHQRAAPMSLGDDAPDDHPREEFIVPPPPRTHTATTKRTALYQMTLSPEAPTDGGDV